MIILVKITLLTAQHQSQNQYLCCSPLILVPSRGQSRGQIAGSGPDNDNAIQEGSPNEKNQPDPLFKKLKRMPILGSEALTKSELNFTQFNHEKIKPKVPSIPSIMSAVAQHYQVDINELKSVNRLPNNHKPRAIAIYLSCLLSNQKSQIIANSFTNTSTQGVLKAFCRLKQEIESDIALQKEINYLIKCLSVVVVGT